MDDSRRVALGRYLDVLVELMKMLDVVKPGARARNIGGRVCEVLNELDRVKGGLQEEHDVRVTSKAPRQEGTATMTVDGCGDANDMCESTVVMPV